MVHLSAAPCRKRQVGWKPLESHQGHYGKLAEIFASL